jgi:hypothetical protein
MSNYKAPLRDIQFSIFELFDYEVATDRKY